MRRGIKTVGEYKRCVFNWLIRYFINYRTQLFYYWELEIKNKNGKAGQSVSKEIIRIKEFIDYLKHEKAYNPFGINHFE